MSSEPPHMLYMDEDCSPYVSIVIATYNNIDTVRQCIESVVQQTFTNYELILVDGGSVDGTTDVIARYRNAISYFVSESDSGIYNAWNKGLSKARGEWICFIGADDFLWNNESLSNMSNQLSRVPSNINVVYGKVMLLDCDGNSLYAIGEPWRRIRRRFRQLMCLPHPGAMHRRCLFEKHGDFNESFQIAGDYELLLRELMTGEAFYAEGICIVGMRQGGVSSSPIKMLLSLNETRRAQKLHGQNFPPPLWIIAIMKIHLRQAVWRLFGEEVARTILDKCRRILGLPRFWTRT